MISNEVGERVLRSLEKRSFFRTPWLKILEKEGVALHDFVPWVDDSRDREERFSRIRNR